MRIVMVAVVKLKQMEALVGSLVSMAVSCLANGDHLNAALCIG